MISPEVWNFSPPRSSLSLKKFTSQKDILNILKKQLFTHQVTVTIPDAVRLPQGLINTLVEDNDYYRINNVKASELIDNSFIELFVRNGKLTALSIESSTNDDTSLAFTPDGEFILIVNKYLVETIGIPCKNQDSDLFVFFLDVLTGHLKHLENLQHKLLELELKFDIILTWEPNNENVCPSSVVNYFYKKGYTVKTCHIQYKQNVQYNINVPVLNEDTEAVDYLEWLGAFNLQCNLSSDNYISSLSYLGVKEIFGQICGASFIGLISAKKIENFLHKIQQEACNKQQNWVSVVLKGFDNSFIKQSKNTIEAVDDHHHVIVFQGETPTLVSFFSTGKKHTGHKTVI